MAASSCHAIARTDERARLDHIDRLIAEAVDDVRADRKNAACRKLAAARGNLVLLTAERRAAA